MSLYFRGQGKLFSATRDALGNPQTFEWLGNAPELKIGFTVDYLEHKESYTGQSMTDLKIVKSKSTTLNFTLQEFTKSNLAKALYGTALNVAAGTAIVGEVLGGTPPVTMLAVGQVFSAAKRNGSLVTIIDSSATPKTLVLGTNYTLEPNSMTIDLINVTTGGPFLGPLKVSYTPGISTEIALFNTVPPDLFLRFVGMNMADTGHLFTVDLYKCNIAPAKELALIGDDFGALALEGAALIDVLKSSSSALGQFGAIYQQT